MTAISFSQIPASLRLPGTYLEFDASLAGLAQASFKRLIIGQRLASGTVAANVPTRVTSVAQAEEYFGRGSMLASMLAHVMAIDPWTETWAIALDDNGAGTAATGTITGTGPVARSGTLNMYIGGRRVQVPVASGDTATVVAAAIVSAVNADTSLPVTASSTSGTVTLTARHAGECGNDIDIRLNYYGETTPDGLSLAITPMSGGTGNPDISTAIAAMGSDWYRWIAMPYTDAANLSALEAELDSRYGAMQQIGGRAFAAIAGSHATVTTWGNGRNSPHVSVLATQGSPTQPCEISAIYCAVASQALAIDPARPLQTLPLTGMLAPSIVDRWSDTERNLALFDGISTYKVGPDGACRIEAAITQYQVNQAGVDDTAYLYVNTPETLELHRYNVRSEIGLRYPRHKLAGDAQPVSAGQAIVRPKDIRATMLAVYKREIEQGLMEDFEGYKASLFVEIDPANPTRVNVVDQPNLVNQLRVFANLVQFRI
ncbi:MAG: phage tail protein [Gammaproteobacteria bacterium]|nr:MAG: phage tail protein [Gammaproteobacteria bacterium]